MTVASTITTKQYTGNGATTQFAFPNKIFSASDLQVTIIDNLGNQFPFTNFANAGLGLTYTVQGVDVDTGCTVVLSAALTNLWTIDIRSVVPQTQSTSIKNQGSFLPELHEEEFDRLTRNLQDLLRRTYTFGIHGPDIESTPWPALPAPSVRAGAGLVFDTNGLPTLGVLASTVMTGSIIANLLNLVTTIAPTADKVRTAAEASAGVTPVNYAWPPLSINRYGGKGDNATDCWLAIKTAWNVAVANGGGRITFPDGGTYLVGSKEAFTLNIPQQQNDGSIAYVPFGIGFYFVGGGKIDFDFGGSAIRTTLNQGEQFFLFDKSSNVRLLAPKFLGTQVQSSGVVSLGPITGGSGYTNGLYNNIFLTGGTGSNAVATITVAGGAVTAVQILYVGGNYVVGDTLSANAANIGGTGSGFSVQVTSVTGAGPTTTVGAPNSIACVSLTGNVSNITVQDLYADHMFTGFYAVTDPTGGFTVSGISLTGTSFATNCQYGVALHNAGDDTVIENLHTYRVDRPIFFYGVQNVNATVIGEQTNFGFQPLIKAYSRSTRNVHMRFTALNMQGQSDSVPRFQFHVQTSLNPPPYLDLIYLDYDEQNVYSAGGNGIEFDYLDASGTQQSTTNNLIFQNFFIRGFTAQRLMTTVTLASSGNQCPINYDGLTFTKPPAANDLSLNGFVSSRQFTYTPTVLFGAANTGWTFSTIGGEYYISGGLCFVCIRITVSAKGSATGVMSVSLPLPPRLVITKNPLITGMMQSNGAGLSGPITGFVQTGAGVQKAVPFVQGAVNAAQLTDANFTASSDLLLQAVYPV